MQEEVDEHALEVWLDLDYGGGSLFESIWIVLIQRFCYPQTVLRPVKVLSLSLLRAWVLDSLPQRYFSLSGAGVFARDVVKDRQTLMSRSIHRHGATERVRRRLFDNS